MSHKFSHFSDQDLVNHIELLERMRQDFVANVSHELRTPLTVIHGYLDILLDQEHEASSADLKKIFQQMQQQSLRMERLVADLLLLSRLEIEVPKEENFKLVEVSLLLKQIYRDATALSAKRKHHFSLQIDKNLKIYGLENELRSAFSNIVYNAVHYTPSKGHITIQWYSDTHHAYFKVSDSGIGIAPEHLPRVTERFYRVDRARSRESGGTGLGLAIAKHALIRHQAQLKIESELNQGSIFTCIFPKKMIV
jgi:two-component system phosphate regulon sensor histidine kinase PhoR